MNQDGVIITDGETVVEVYPGGMTEKEYEAAITDEIARVCHFVKLEDSHYWRCNLCGKRFHEHYIGYGVNERMLDHYAEHAPEIRRMNLIHVTAQERRRG